jgi:hypothetical protein
MSTINYTVTVSGGLFLIDSAEKPALTFRDGDTYVFDQADSSNASNTLRFSATSDNSGASEYTTGVTVTGTAGSAGAKTTIITSGSTTDTLYYYSGDTAGYGEEFSNSGYNTTSEGILKPIVGAAAEKWGPMLNHSIDQISDLKAPLASPAFTGTPTGIVTGSIADDAVTGGKLANDIAINTSIMPQVGSVSIVASGSNSNGFYTKWSDGTVTAHKLVSFSSITLNPANGGSSAALTTDTTMAVTIADARYTIGRMLLKNSINRDLLGISTSTYSGGTAISINIINSGYYPQSYHARYGAALATSSDTTCTNGSYEMIAIGTWS